MTFRPFGIGGWRGTGRAGINLWANVSVLIGVGTYIVAVLLFNGVFLGGPSACGGFALTCWFEPLAALVVGGATGALMALAALAGSHKQRWLSWLALELNGFAILAVGAYLLWLFATS